MDIEYKSNFSAESLAKEVLENHKKELERAMSDAKDEIHTRTLEQRGAYGGSFKRLNEKYQRYKVSKGRRGVPDLTFTGAMLRAMITEVKVIGKDIIGYIKFSSAKEAAKAQGNIDNGRNFFELSDKQKETIAKKIQG